MKNNPAHRSHILILLITLLAFALRIAFLEGRALTIDEASSLKAIAGRSPLYIATHYHTNSHLLISLLARLIDYGGHWLSFYRAPSFVFGVLTIPLTYRLGRRLLDERVGILGALLLAVAPFHLDFSLQMRGYATMTFWALVMYLCLWEALTKDGYRYWLLLVLAAVVTAYAHLFGLVAVGASWLIVAGAGLAQWRQGDRPGWLNRALISTLLTIGGLAILYGPIMGRILATPEAEEGWGTQIEATFVDGSLNVEALEDYLKVLRFYGPIGEPNSWFVLSFVVLAGIGLIGAWVSLLSPTKGTRRAALYLAAWLFTPMIAASLGLQFIPGFYVFRRFFMFVQPLYLLLMAGGIFIVGGWLGRWSKRASLGGLVTALLIAVALGAASWKLYHQISEDTHEQWYRVAQTILTQGTNPMVICEAQGQRMEEGAAHRDDCYRSLEFYLQPALGEYIPWLHREIDQVATIPGATKLPELEAQAGDVWLVLWQRDWPSQWPTLPQTPQAPGLNYYSIGSALLVQAPARPVQLLALAEIVDALILLETTPQDRFSYYLSQAQMKAVVGDRETARAAFLAAQALSPAGVDAPNRLRAVAELIGMTELVEAK